MAADGDKRSFTMAKDTDRSLTLDTIAEHYRGAGYVGKLPPFDGASRDRR
ncbi:MAG: hypothetical protein ABIT38_06750 [Gemmatimonadaceae bacterium]